MTRISALWVMSPLILAACDSAEIDPLPTPDGSVLGDASVSGDGGSGADGGASTDSGLPDPTEPYFDPAHLVEVVIEIGADDWDSLRAEAREFPGILIGEQCLDEPFTSPYQYYAGRVTVDGTVLEQVGVRKKGFLGSLSEIRPSLKLKFDEFVPNQLLAQMERLTLNNGQQDPSSLRTCLAYWIFARAGLPAPRCNFAHVTVNGVDMGVYAHVEEIEKPFLRRHFDDDEGLLYEGTLSDFRDGWLGTFERKTNTEIPDDKTALGRVARALQGPPAEMIDALEEVVDVEAFLRFWAMEGLLAHWDGYTGNANNFFVYLEPLTERFYFLPWGPDAVLSSSPFLPEGAPAAVQAVTLLPQRLYADNEIRARYLAQLTDLLDTVWNETEVLTDIDSAATLIRPRVLEPQRFDTAVAELRDVVRTRRAVLEPEIQIGGVDWPFPIRGSPCWSEVGRIRAELTTTWGSHPAQNPLATGTGTLAGSFMDTQFAGATVGGAAGFGVNPDDQGQAVLLAVALTPENAIIAFYAVVPPELVVSGASIPIDLTATRAFVLFAPRPGAELQLVGWVGLGDIQVLEADLTNGAPIRISVDAAILGSGGL